MRQNRGSVTLGRYFWFWFFAKRVPGSTGVGLCVMTIVLFIFLFPLAILGAEGVELLYNTRARLQAARQ